MANQEPLPDHLEAELHLPDGWGVFSLHNPGAYELSGYDGEEMQRETLELLVGDHVIELVINHADMPGRASNRDRDEFDELEEPVMDIPSQVGVLRFDDLEDAIAAANELADPEVLAEVTELRSGIEQETPVSVRESVAEVTNIDMETIPDTSTVI